MASGLETVSTSPNHDDASRRTVREVLRAVAVQDRWDDGTSRYTPGRGRSLPSTARQGARANRPLRFAGGRPIAPARGEDSTSPECSVTRNGKRGTLA